MLHTPLKHHVVVGHGHAHHAHPSPQASQSVPCASVRCSPHASAQAHDVNLADWLHLSPAQAGLVSPMSAPIPASHFSTPGSLYVPSPMQYAVRNDFMHGSHLPYASPFIHSFPGSITPAGAYSLPVPIITIENTHIAAASPHPMHPQLSAPGDANLFLSYAEYLSYASSSHPNSSSPSPLAHHTVPDESDSSSREATIAAAQATALPALQQSQTGLPVGQPSQKQLIDLLREASPASSMAVSPLEPTKASPMKARESQESPFRIAQPQPRLETNVDTSSLSELAEVASRQSTPSVLHSRPSSALSSHPHAKNPRIQRRYPIPPRRFAPSPLQVNLPYMQSQLSQSFTDSLVDSQRGPLEFEKDGHRYRTRSKLKSLKAEIQEREREDDLLLIRRGMRKGSGENGAASSLDLLATVSVTRRSRTPQPEETLTSKTLARVKRGTKRIAKDFDTESTTSTSTGSDARRSPSKRARLEKSLTPAQRADASPNGRIRTQPSQRSLKEKEQGSSVRLASTRTITGKVKKAESGTEGLSRIVEDEFSSLSSLSDVDYEPEARQKKRLAPRKSALKPDLKQRTAMEGKLLALDDNAPIDIPVRTFPEGIPKHPSFPLLYRRFPLCGYMDPQNSRVAPLPGPLPGGHFNAPRSAEDLYTPRFVRGVGREKAGLCPICYESKTRGGTGKAEWLSMKFSAFNYHMQYAHGISPTTTQPFSPPIAFRIVERKPNHKNEKAQLLEGQCHRCREWAPVEGVKCVEAKLKEIYWWKHAAACHKGSTLEGERDIHLQDEVSKRVLAAYKQQHGGVYAANSLSSAVASAAANPPRILASSSAPATLALAHLARSAKASADGVGVFPTPQMLAVAATTPLFTRKPLVSN